MGKKLLLNINIINAHTSTSNGVKLRPRWDLHPRIAVLQTAVLATSPRGRSPIVIRFARYYQCVVASIQNTLQISYIFLRRKLPLAHDDT